VDVQADWIEPARLLFDLRELGRKYGGFSHIVHSLMGEI
jgi:hypothetical protein